MSPAFRRIVVLAVGTALLMGLTAAPLSAAKPEKKTYDVTVYPVTVPYVPDGVDQDFTLRYTNTTPFGISSFNSLTLTAPDGFVIDFSSLVVTTSTGDMGFTVSTSASAPNITVTNLYPVSFNEWVELAFTANVSITATTCDGAVGTWLTEAWTGSNTGGNSFALQEPPPTTTVGTPLAPGASTSFGGVTLTNVGTACSPVTLTRNGNQIYVYKPEDPSLAFTVEVNAWDPEDANAPMSTWTEVDTPAPDHDIKWCIGTWDLSSPADMSGITMPASEVSCLLRQETNIAGTDALGAPLVQVQEWIYLTGDWGAKHG